MISRLAVQPDLQECLLEERVLPYAGPGLYAPQFIPTAGSTPSFIVSGFQQANSSPGSSGNTYPGPQFFFIQIGISSVSNGGVRLGGTSSVFQPPQVLPTVQGATVGSVPGSGGATGGISAPTGYGGAISSGYNTSLNSSNNYGMGTTAVGSVSAHVSGANDQLTEAQAANASTTTPASAQDAPDTNAPPANPAPGLFSPQDRLLGKGLGSSNGLLIGPGMSNNPSSLSPPRP